ncbi:MAG: uracil-DNA glycosylase [Coraliomargarita sp.]
MSNVLRAVTSELKRLQQEGLDHVFIDDSTLTLLQNQAAERKSATATSVSADLKSLITDQASPETPVAAKVESTRKTAASVLPEPPQMKLPDGTAESKMAWLRSRVESCPTCNEHLSEHGKVVFGVGNADADVFFCGEAPGADEERAGEPFVGKAGQLLTKIIQAMGLSREKVYIGNILKWRPEHDKPYGNRPPTAEEMAFCLPYLKAQLEIVQPKVIVALGNTAVTGLLGPDPTRRMSDVRGTWSEFSAIPLMITFHPSYLLRNDTLKTKRMVWEDMLQVMEKTELPISEKQRGYFLPKR